MVFERARHVMRIATTLAILAIATVVVLGLWDYYTAAPWTRNGQVRVQVANIAPRVSGQIVDVRVTDNQYVHRGDVLYSIDPFDFRIAVASATARVNERQADLTLRLAQHQRRQQLSSASASAEEKQQFEAVAEQAKAQYADALAALSQARMNLDRTQVRSTVNGYVTNLTMRVGDFATAGVSDIEVIDAESYWVDGYFEETRMRGIYPGALVRIDLMGYATPLWGHVETITRGISSANAQRSTQGLPLVNPVYTWVRLAQRIPVRVHIDALPAGITLAAGMTASVSIVTPEGRQPRVTLRALVAQLRQSLHRVRPPNAVAASPATPVPSPTSLSNGVSEDGQDR
ncbi:efflux transporter, RND family, MFP subunit [Gluconacetobacter diazotrophicus PA1 5]|nr:efflux transporter, RND family, MFP subunit [Gluconacetobacter diazotrophicus PA1 5]TWB08510.1 RND family efflux transporter MFP subunit [Gluconacetobacter diazotrophicus]